MKKAFFISSICFIISISLSIMHVMKPVLLIIKYLTLVFAFAYLGYACFQTRIKKRNNDPILAGGNHSFRIYYPDDGYVSISRN